MSDYQHTVTVNSPPDTIFDFVSDVANLPKYLPTTTSAEPQGTDRVRVKGEVAGHAYDADGYFRITDSVRRIEWGADGDRKYAGWLQVEGGDSPIATDDAARARVTVHLTFGARQGGTDASDADVQRGLEASLQSIKNILEGKGGKIEPKV